MPKIGRNDPCPCGSGRKYKRCCLGRRAPLPRREATPVISLHAEVERICGQAARREAGIRELGVFIFYADRAGDAWLLEVTEADAVQLARAGEPLDPVIEQNPETITVEWSHAFAIRDKTLFYTSHEDGTETRADNAPVKEISAAIRRIRKRYAPELLEKVHLDVEQEGDSGT